MRSCDPQVVKVEEEYEEKKKQCELLEEELNSLKQECARTEQNLTTEINELRPCCEQLKVLWSHLNTLLH